VFLHDRVSIEGISPSRIVIVAAGEAYQRAAAWAAATYAHKCLKSRVTVLLPSGESQTTLLVRHARNFHFEIERFRLELVSEHKYTSQLKCQAYKQIVASLAKNETVLFVDADTCCFSPIHLNSKIQKAITEGRIGLSKDIQDNHFIDPESPWYLPRPGRLPYVNSGVLLAGSKSKPLFSLFSRLSKQPKFLTGPFNDQKVINYALGTRASQSLVVIPRRYNWISRVFPPHVLIGHFAGGAGYLGQQRRGGMHIAACMMILQERQSRPLPEFASGSRRPPSQLNVSIK
jgi:hypothetical protein